ncbi:MAG: PAS domain-containing hybrid sensor histidine kinase/response regulator [Hyphomicrobiaceae bacterium]
MLDGWLILIASLGYLGLLFLIAYFGDQLLRRRRNDTGWPLIYSLTLAVYCTSWTFFGSVGVAASTGLDFLPVYLGPILMLTIGRPLVLRVVRIAKSQNITSIADFIAARYGKSPTLALVVTLIAVLGSIPYIALQLRAIATSAATLLGETQVLAGTLPSPIDTGFLIAIAMAAFAILFGTRHVDATEHQDGLMLAIATESLVKLCAFLVVGGLVTFTLFDGPSDLFARALADPAISGLYFRGQDGGRWLTVTLLSFVCILLLPRQFHVAVVENHSEREVRRAGWLFPIYLALINVFVVPIAMGGLLLLPKDAHVPDMFVLALPMATGEKWITLLAFLGGLSAAMAMVIVESVALSIMVCNDIVMPQLLRRGWPTSGNGHPDGREEGDRSRLLLRIRRWAIFAILLLAYLFHGTINQTAGLAAIGLLSFAAMAQFAPAFFGGLVWRRATSSGAIAGILAGFAVWSYTLMLPWFMDAGFIDRSMLETGPFGITLLRPRMLFNMHFEPLTHGVLWSLAANIAVYVAVSMLRLPEPIERLQANIFVLDQLPSPSAPVFRLWRTSITVEDLESTAARYVGAERAQRSFREYARSRSVPYDRQAEADIALIRFSEHLLASAIGAASSRLVMSLLIRRHSVSNRSALKLLDDASEALHYNRDLLQSALDQVGQGIAVWDRNLTLICWNQQFRNLLGLPAEFGRVGVPVDHVVRFLAERGDFGDGQIDELVKRRVDKIAVTRETFQDRIGLDERVLEISTSPMPQGGFVVTFTDITERAMAAEALERRVAERTAELTHVNKALAIEKSKADAASLDKTRFLAAASHDILQPLNAARLYVSTLVDHAAGGPDERLVRNVEASLEAVEEILGALLDISRLDAGALPAEMTDVSLGEMLDRLRVEFDPLAREKGIGLTMVPTSLYVRSDRRLLRRMLQNLVSNAIKYTPEGRVLVGCRRHGTEVVVEVIDTGTGIPADKQVLIFREFERLAANSHGTRGLGLGLSIVERIGRVLGVPIRLTSTVGRGSRFSLRLPRGTAVVEPQPTTDGEAPATAPVGPQAGLCVLCIDNEPAIVESMTLLLTGWGCRVIAAENIPDAVAVATAGTRPDIILADYHLDEGTGIEAIEMIRQALGEEVPAAIITADHSPEMQRDVRWRGHALLRKPLKPAALRAVLVKVRQRVAAE